MSSSEIEGAETSILYLATKHPNFAFYIENKLDGKLISWERVY